MIRVLQQYLPFTVLKHDVMVVGVMANATVATVLTVYGIETIFVSLDSIIMNKVATVLTVYGIETPITVSPCGSSKLQQYLPFTVLKHSVLYYRGRRIPSCNSTYRLRY